MKVYLFGECYFQKFEDLLKETDGGSQFDFENLSISNGSIKAFLMMLKCKKNLEKGVFLVGGSLQDKWGWESGKIAKQIINWFDTCLFDSLLIFCLTGSLNKQEDLHNFYNEEKKKFANQRNIFSLDLRFDANQSVDGIHVGVEEKKVMAKKTIEFLKTISFVFSTEELACFTDKILVDKPYRNITIFHGHNKSIFEIKNNNKIIKKYAFYLLPQKTSEGHILYMDRPMITEIEKPQVGTINFSERVYVDKVIMEM